MLLLILLAIETILGLPNLSSIEIQNPLMPYLNDKDVTALSGVNRALNDVYYKGSSLETNLRSQLRIIEDKCGTDTTLVLFQWFFKQRGKQPELGKKNSECIDAIKQLCKLDKARNYIKSSLQFGSVFEKREIPAYFLSLAEACPVKLSVPAEMAMELQLNSDVTNNIIELELRAPRDYELPKQEIASIGSSYLNNLKDLEIRDTTISPGLVTLVLRLIPKNLRTLKLSAVSADQTNTVGFFEHFQSIEKMELRSCEISFPQLTRLRNTVRYLQFGAREVLNDHRSFFNILSHFSNLETLVIVYHDQGLPLVDFEDATFMHDVQLPPSLKHLELFNSPYLHDSNMFGNLENLQTLTTHSYDLRETDSLPLSLLEVNANHVVSSIEKWLKELSKLEDLKALKFHGSYVQYDDLQNFLADLPDSLIELAIKDIEIMDSPWFGTPSFKTNKLTKFSLMTGVDGRAQTNFWANFLKASTSLEKLELKCSATESDMDPVYKLIPLSVRHLIVYDIHRNFSGLKSRLDQLIKIAQRSADKFSVTFTKT